MNIKHEIRILGIDDSPFNKKSSEKVLIIGAVFRGASQIDGVLSTYVSRDGTDATKKIISLIKKTRHLGQLRVVMINGVCVAGLNPLDIKKIHDETKLPVIIVTRNKPNPEKLRKAFMKIKGFKKRWQAVENAGPVREFMHLYFQFKGISEEDVKKIIRLTAVHSIVPEPVRTAHLIAGGIVSGESRARV